MKERGFSGDERGVSPVIGVILMVAIVVILGTVLGAFALGVFNEGMLNDELDRFLPFIRPPVGLLT